MRPNRKERKRLADIKRAKYTEMIVNEAARLTKPEPFNKYWILALDTFVKDLIATNHLDAHLIRSAAKKFQRVLLKEVRKS